MPLHVRTLKEKITTSKDTQFRIIFNIAIALGKLDQFTECKDFFEQYVSAIPHDATGWKFRGNCYAALNEFENVLPSTISNSKISR